MPATKTYPACNLVFVGEMERWRKREKKSEMEREKKRVIDRVAPGGSIYSM